MERVRVLLVAQAAQAYPAIFLDQSHIMAVEDQGIYLVLRPIILALQGLVVAALVTILWVVLALVLALQILGEGEAQGPMEAVELLSFDIQGLQNSRAGSLLP